MLLGELKEQVAAYILAVNLKEQVSYTLFFYFKKGSKYNYEK